MKAAKQTKSDLQTLIRDTQQTQFEVIEPVTPGSLSRVEAILRRELTKASYLTVIVIRRK